MNASSITIRASAGTGKTYQLTRRILALLLMGVPPTRILATTFTRKAAGEIRDRVLGRLAAAVSSEDERSRLSRELGFDATRDGCLETLRKVIADLDRISFCTIDSFLVRLAKACADEIDLPMEWRVADDGEDTRLRREAIDRVLEEMSFEERVRAVSRLHKGLYHSTVTELLLSVAGLLDAHLESEARAWRRELPPNEPTQESLDALVEALAKSPVNTNAKGKPDLRWVRGLGALSQLVAQRRWGIAAEHSLVQSSLQGSPSYYGACPRAELAAPLEAIVTTVRNVVIRRLALCNAESIAFLERFGLQYRKLQAILGITRLADVTATLRDALRTTGLASLYYRLDARFDHIMLDEFQDTSIAQYEVLIPILAEVLSEVGPGGIGSRSLVCVGDAKQTLYRWRNAEPIVLDHVATTWRQVPVVHLDKSYRSSPEIVSAVNTVFGTLRSNPVLAGHAQGAPASENWASLFTQQTTARDEPGFVRVTSAREPTDSESAAEIVLVTAANAIADLWRRSPNMGIGVLTRSRNPIPRLVALLRERGIPACEDSSSLLGDQPIVAAVLSALRTIDHPGDTLAHFHCTTSPLQAALKWPLTVGPELNVALDNARVDIAHHGLGDTISTWHRSAHAALTWEEHAAMNDLTDAAYKFDGGSWNDLSQFAETVSTTRTRIGASAPVRVMTVHASKGLEFDAVFLPELDKPLYSTRPPNAYVTREDGFGKITSVICFPKKEDAACDPAVAAMRDSARIRLIEEELCVLYVAMTRARRHLEMIVAPQKPSKSTGEVKLRLSHAGVLCGALATSPAAPPGSTLFQCGEAGWMTREEQEVQSKPPSQPVKLDPVPSFRVSADTISPPTNLAGAFVLLDDQAVMRGRLFHAWFEQIEWADDQLPPVSALRDAAARIGRFDRTALDRELDRFVSLVRTGELGRLLRRSHYRDLTDSGATLRVLRERRFTVQDASLIETPSFVTGQFDRCVVALQDGRPEFAEVLDFKTDTITAEDPGLVRLLNRYHDQLTAYRSGAATLFSLPPDRIRCTLVSTSTDRWISI